MDDTEEVVNNTNSVLESAKSSSSIMQSQINTNVSVPRSEEINYSYITGDYGEEYRMYMEELKNGTTDKSKSSEDMHKMTSTNKNKNNLKTSTPEDLDIDDEEDSDLLKLLDSIGDTHKGRVDTASKSTESKVKKSRQDVIIEEDGVIFEKGMSLIEFLRKNKDINDIPEVLKYYSKKDIDAAVKSSKVFKKKNKLII